MADMPSQRITISDVAREAGVSRTTVSHALNGRGQVDPATRLKVEEAARSLGYRPNRHAQRLRTGGASMIALMSSMPFTVSGGPSRLGFFMEVAAVAASSALERGLVMALVPPHKPGQTSLNLLDIDGALVIEPQAGDPQLAELLQQGLPVVSIGRPGGDNVNVPYVDLLSGPATQMLLTHMLAAGARQIGLVVGASERTSYSQAEQAYAAMAAGHGMRPVVLRMDEAEGEDGGHAAAQQLLGEHPELDALLVMVDAFAVGAARYAQQAGLRIPEDLMLATRYDGLRARSCEPPLTALDLHLEDIAQQAVDLLFEHLRGDTTRRMATGPLPDLALRRSTQRKPG